MKIEDAVYEADCMVSAQIEEDLKSYDYDPKQAAVATVLTRVDVGVLVFLCTVNAKLLRSICLSAWGIFGLLLVRTLIEFF